MKADTSVLLIVLAVLLLSAGIGGGWAYTMVAPPAYLGESHGVYRHR